MKLWVRAGEREEEVEVDRAGSGYRVSIGGRLYQVDRDRAGAFSSLIIDGQQHEVVLRAAGPARYQVLSVGFAGTVEVLDRLARLAGASGGAGNARSVRQATAYMPGRVVALLLAEGDPVSEGQGVLVLEAMKMENEIQAEASGRIKKIHVEPGQAVESGDPLFEIAPQERQER